MEKEKLNVYQKLQKCRTELQKKDLKKSGNNKFAGFNYFELSDFLPAVNELFYENGLCSMFNLHQATNTASLEVINVDNLEDRIIFEAPVAEANIKGCTPIQSLGGQITYLRRYLYMNALEIVESDMLDSNTGNIEVETIEITEEYAKNYVLNFGKHKGKKLGDLVRTSPDYLDWLFNSDGTEETIKQCIKLLQKEMPTDEEKEEILSLITKTNMLFDITGTDRDKVYEYYKVTSNSEMSLQQLRELVQTLEKRAK